MLIRASLFALSLLLASGASAQITINSTADAESSSDGQCTLREAIIAGNTDTASGAVAGECAAGNGADEVAVDLAPGSTITLEFHLPSITQSWSLTGPSGDASGLTIDGDDQYRMFDFDTNDQQTLTLRGITVTGGLSNAGGGILVGFQNDCFFEDIAVVSNIATSAGGGIYTGAQGICTMNRVHVADNEAEGPAGGGGIRVGNSGSAVIRNSTIENNRAPQSSGGGILVGFFSPPAATFVLEQSTVSGNMSGGGGGGVAEIGINGTNTIRASIITDNHITDGSSAGGGLSVSAPTTYESTVIAGNTAVRGSGEWDDLSLGNNNTTSGGGNLIGINGFFDSQFPLGAPNANGDFVGNEAGPLDPLVEPLSDNGGPMPTHLPQSGSPMLDAGVCPGSAADQRGSIREVDVAGTFNFNGDACDMGPVEGRAFVVDAEPLAQRTIHLSAPAPNPARGIVQVAFETVASGDLSLTVVDLLGREVAVLARGMHAAGEHSAALDTAPLAPGVYVVRLATPEVVAIRRVTVVR